MLVVGLVFIGDSVQIEPVGNLPFLEALDEFTIERAQFMRLDILEVFITSLEVPFALIWPIEFFCLYNSMYCSFGTLFFQFPLIIPNVIIIK